MRLADSAGEEVPRRIVLGGWGLGGSLATSFAPWTGMHVRRLSSRILAV